MSDVSVQLVRDFFEVNAFHVMTYWQHDAVRARGIEQGLQLYVENTAFGSEAHPCDFVLRVGDVSALPRGVVEVRAWHADRFYASLLESNPVLFEVAMATPVACAGHDAKVASCTLTGSGEGVSSQIGCVVRQPRRSSTSKHTVWLRADTNSSEMFWPATTVVRFCST